MSTSLADELRKFAETLRKKEAATGVPGISMKGISPGIENPTSSIAPKEGGKIVGFGGDMGKGKSVDSKSGPISTPKVL
jgi:hypothetical protein